VQNFEQAVRRQEILRHEIAAAEMIGKLRTRANDLFWMS
jgi:hypothetical protein